MINCAIYFFCNLGQVWFSSPSLSASIVLILTTCYFGSMVANCDK